jgi:hypothetical protein
LDLLFNFDGTVTKMKLNDTALTADEIKEDHKDGVITLKD